MHLRRVPAGGGLDARGRAKFQGRDHRIQRVRPAVAHHPAAKIPEAAPRLRMVGPMVRPHGRRADPQVPVQRCGNGRRFLGPVRPRAAPAGMAPGIIGKAAPGIDFADLADQARGDPLADQPVAFHAVALDAHLRGHLVLLGRLGELAGFIDRVRQRFLAVDVLAGLDGRHGDHGMRMIGRGDHHAVDVLLLLQHQAIVFVGLRLGILLEGRVRRRRDRRRTGRRYSRRGDWRGCRLPCRRSRCRRCSSSRWAGCCRGPPSTCRGTIVKAVAAPARETPVVRKSRRVDLCVMDNSLHVVCLPTYSSRSAVRFFFITAERDEYVFTLLYSAPQFAPFQAVLVGP